MTRFVTSKDVCQRLDVVLDRVLDVVSHSADCRLGINCVLTSPTVCGTGNHAYRSRETNASELF